MIDETNDFYNFMMDVYRIFKKEDGTTLKQAWELYKTYCEDAKVPYPLSMRGFKNELKTYFREHLEQYYDGNGEHYRNYYKGFKTDILEKDISEQKI